MKFVSSCPLRIDLIGPSSALLGGSNGSGALCASCLSELLGGYFVLVLVTEMPKPCIWNLTRFVLLPQRGLTFSVGLLLQPPVLRPAFLPLWIGDLVMWYRIQQPPRKVQGKEVSGLSRLSDISCSPSSDVLVATAFTGNVDVH